jgi:hypothetical protein
MRWVYSTILTPLLCLIRSSLSCRSSLPSSAILLPHSDFITYYPPHLYSFILILLFTTFLCYTLFSFWFYSLLLLPSSNSSLHCTNIAQLCISLQWDTDGDRLLRYGSHPRNHKHCTKCKQSSCFYLSLPSHILFLMPSCKCVEQYFDTNMAEKLLPNLLL